jgi:hypothetical protein
MSRKRRNNVGYWDNGQLDNKKSINHSRNHVAEGRMRYGMAREVRFSNFVHTL